MPKSSGQTAAAALRAPTGRIAHDLRHSLNIFGDRGTRYDADACACDSKRLLVCHPRKRMATTLLAVSAKLDDTQRFVRLTRFLRRGILFLRDAVSGGLVGTGFMVDDLSVRADMGDDMHRSIASEAVDRTGTAHLSHRPFANRDDALRRTAL